MAAAGVETPTSGAGVAMMRSMSHASTPLPVTASANRNCPCKHDGQGRARPWRTQKHQKQVSHSSSARPRCRSVACGLTRYDTHARTEKSRRTWYFRSVCATGPSCARTCAQPPAVLLPSRRSKWSMTDSNSDFCALSSAICFVVAGESMTICKVCARGAEWFKASSCKMGV